MAKNESTSTTLEAAGDGGTVVRTEGSHESDSVMLKKDAKGVYSWELKAYGDFSTEDGIIAVTGRIQRVNDILQGGYHA